MLNRNARLEFKRKVFHGGLTGTIAPLLIILVKDPMIVRAIGLSLYTAFLILFFLLEYSLKTGRGWNVPFATKAYKTVANEYETENRTLLGAIFIILSGMLLIAFFDLYAALVGIMVLSYADSAAAIFGKSLPQHPLPYNRWKHLEGTLAFTLVAFTVTLFSLYFAPMTYPRLLIVSLIISTVAAFVESLPIKYYYDNLTVPISSGLLAQLFLALN